MTSMSVGSWVARSIQEVGNWYEILFMQCHSQDKDSEMRMLKAYFKNPLPTVEVGLRRSQWPPDQQP